MVKVGMGGEADILREMAVAQSQVVEGIRIPIPRGAIEAFCCKWKVREFALFGSVLRPDFRLDSDVDVLVTFEAGGHPTLFDLAGMELELERLFRRKVDLSERGGFERCQDTRIRTSVLQSLRMIYAR